MKILDYIPPHAEIGVGLALRLTTDEYIFFLPGHRHPKEINELFYAGVGGHLEPGEDLLACGRREAMEEIGLEIRYESSPGTFYMDCTKNIREIEVEDEIKPLAIYEMIYPKGAPKEGGMYHIVIFDALIGIEPQCFQETEVSGAIVMSKEQVRRGNRRAAVQEYIQEGARIIGTEVNPETTLYPIGTAEALAYLFSELSSERIANETEVKQ